MSFEPRWGAFEGLALCGRDRRLPSGSLLAARFQERCSEARAQAQVGLPPSAGRKNAAGVRRTTDSLHRCSREQRHDGSRAGPVANIRGDRPDNGSGVCGGTGYLAAGVAAAPHAP